MTEGGARRLVGSPGDQALGGSDDAPNLWLQGVLSQDIYLEAQLNVSDSNCHLDS